MTCWEKLLKTRRWSGEYCVETMRASLMDYRSLDQIDEIKVI